jgi:hypothetical protein
MSLKILLLAISTAALCSCSSTYKNGQTPDDVYFSPVKTVSEEGNKGEEQVSRYPSQEDRQIRMSRYDRRFRDFNDDYNCHYDPYRYGYNYGYYYNPYYCASPIFISGISIKNPKNSTPRMTNLGSYQYTKVNVFDPKTGASQWITTGRKYNNSNHSSSIRRIISPSSNNNPLPSNNNNTRSYSPSGNSSSGGIKSSGTPVTRPGRG